MTATLNDDDVYLLTAMMDHDYTWNESIGQPSAGALWQPAELTDHNYILNSSLFLSQPAAAAKTPREPTVREPPRIFECFHDGYTSTVAATFIQHVLRHLPGCRCEECGRNFRNFAAFHRHIPCNPMVCDACGRSFPSKHSLKVHIEDTQLRNQIAECANCGLVTARKFNLLSHTCVRRLLGPRWTVYCNICERGFDRPAHLDRHLAATNNHRGFECSNCGAHFKRRLGLKRHLSRQCHYVCYWCSKQARHISELATHIRYVHDKFLEEFHCFDCSFMCNCKADFTVHQHGMHMGLRRYKCHLCEKRFCRATARRRHNRDVHQLAPTSKLFACSLCKDYTTRYKANMQRHAFMYCPMLTTSLRYRKPKPKPPTVLVKCEGWSISDMLIW